MCQYCLLIWQLICTLCSPLSFQIVTIIDQRKSSKPKYAIIHARLLFYLRPKRKAQIAAEHPLIYQSIGADRLELSLANQ